MSKCHIVGNLMHWLIIIFQHHTTVSSAYSKSIKDQSFHFEISVVGAKGVGF